MIVFVEKVRVYRGIVGKGKNSRKVGSWGRWLKELSGRAIFHRMDDGFRGKVIQ